MNYGRESKEEDATLWVLDTSKSMSWGVDGNDRCPEGQRRIDHAKRVLIDATRRLSDTLPLGLIVFPSIDPCTPAMVAAIRTGNKTRICELVQAIHVEWTPNMQMFFPCLGGTPLANALRLAGQIVMQFGRAKVIVLTDGAETCGGNPLAEVAQLHNQSIDIHFHIIGFSVNPDEEFQLTQLARVARGTYYSAPTVPRLRDAVDSAVRLLPPAR